MEIKAAMVKELRARTGAGMMECKKALVETKGDMDTAVEILRKKSKAIADKKASRVAAEGRISMAVEAHSVAMIEVNSETDFVSSKQEFCDFAQLLADSVLANDLDSVEALLQSENHGQTFEELRRELIAKIGENITVRRIAKIQTQSNIGWYQHGSRIGVILELQDGDAALAKELSMHVAASSPLCVSADQLPKELLDKEREIYIAQAQDSGKPPEIIEKMVAGQIRKFIGQVTLEGQAFIKDTDKTVAKLLQESEAKVIQFVRFGVGEGIEKKQEDFAAEVMSQVKGG